MKSLLMTLALAAAPVATAAHAADAQFQTKCHVLLSVVSADPNDEDIVIDVASDPFAASGNGFSHSHLVVNADDYAVRAGIELNGPFGDPVVQPRLIVSLVKGGNPITGQVNYSNIGGIDLATRPAGVPLTLTSMNFISAHVNGLNVTRIDYSCSVTKL